MALSTDVGVAGGGLGTGCGAGSSRRDAGVSGDGFVVVEEGSAGGGIWRLETTGLSGARDTVGCDAVGSSGLGVLDGSEVIRASGAAWAGSGVAAAGEEEGPLSPSTAKRRVST